MLVSDSGQQEVQLGCHQELRTFLDRLNDCVCAARMDLEEMQFALRRLEQAMEVRFLREMERRKAIVARTPWREDAVHELQVQQQRLMRELKLIERSCDRHPLHVRTRVADLAERIIEHEAAERLFVG